jgi:hypothetical protein
VRAVIEESSLLERLATVVHHLDDDHTLGWPRLFKLIKKALSAQRYKSSSLQFLYVLVTGAKMSQIQLWAKVLYDLRTLINQNATRGTGKNREKKHLGDQIMAHRASNMFAIASCLAHKKLPPPHKPAPLPF